MVCGRGEGADGAPHKPTKGLSMEHMKAVCDTCEKVIAQCRCKDVDKTVVRYTCDDCKEKKLKQIS